jgi:putative transposase
MAQSLSRILLHLVYSTYQRQPLILPEIQPQLHQYLGGILEENDSRAIAIGGMPDHVHLFFISSRNRSVAQMVRNLKVGSTMWLKTQGKAFSNFRWQAGYGVFSVGESQSPTVAEYVRNQERHHQKRGFQTEFLALLKKYKIDYDERYVWD